MQIIRDLKQHTSTSPAVLSIGNFDGVHLGHKTVLQRAKQLARQENQPFAVITFENHPAEILRPQHLLPRLCLVPHKIKLLEQEGVDVLILLKFTDDLAKQSAREFLTYISKHQPFSDLILGHDATIGKNKHGDRLEIFTLANEMHFSVEYLEKFLYHSSNVSSSVIRNLIQEGNLEEVEKLLGRKYSIYGPYINVQGLVHYSVPDLCLPPRGRYPVTFTASNEQIETLADIQDGLIKVPVNHPSGTGEITIS